MSAGLDAKLGAKMRRLYSSSSSDWLHLSTRDVLAPNRVKTRFARSSVVDSGGGGGGCPKHCDCKWKHGKQAVICQSLKRMLTDIPTNVDSGTQVYVNTEKIVRYSSNQAFCDICKLASNFSRILCEQAQNGERKKSQLKYSMLAYTQLGLEGFWI